MSNYINYRIRIIVVHFDVIWFISAFSNLMAVEFQNACTLYEQYYVTFNNYTANTYNDLIGQDIADI